MVIIACFQDQPPRVEIVYPEDGKRVYGGVIIQVLAIDDQGIDYCRFQADDSLLGIDSLQPYMVRWETESLPDQKIYTISATAFDRKGNFDTDSITLIIDYSLRLPVINDFDTSIVRSTSLWLLWSVTDAESIKIYRSLGPGIDTLIHLIAEVPAEWDSFHDLWLNDNRHYYYMISAKDKEDQKTATPVMKERTPSSETKTWIPKVGAWERDGPFDRASSPEELTMILADSANPYIKNDFIDFTRQHFKGRLRSLGPDTNRISLMLFDMGDSSRGHAVYDSTDPGNTIPDSIGNEARYRFDSRHVLYDFWQGKAFVRIYIDSGTQQAIEIIKTFAIYVSALI